MVYVWKWSASYLCSLGLFGIVSRFIFLPLFFMHFFLFSFLLTLISWFGAWTPVDNLCVQSGFLKDCYQQKVKSISAFSEPSCTHSCALTIRCYVSFALPSRTKQSVCTAFPIWCYFFYAKQKINVILRKKVKLSFFFFWWMHAAFFLLSLPLLASSHPSSAVLRCRLAPACSMQ